MYQHANVLVVVEMLRVLVNKALRVNSARDSNEASDISVNININHTAH